MSKRIRIEISRELYRRASAIAGDRGETIGQVLSHALEYFVAEALEEAEDVRAVDEAEAAIAGGAPLFEHADVWHELDKAVNPVEPASSLHRRRAS